MKRNENPENEPKKNWKEGELVMTFRICLETVF